MLFFEYAVHDCVFLVLTFYQHAQIEVQPISYRTHFHVK